MNEGDLGASPSLSKGEVQNKVYGYATANPKVYHLMKKKSHKMKKKPTDAEALLWYFLKNKATGYKIRRQHIVHNFIVDFICLPLKVVIEVDGRIHEKQKERDELRTGVLNKLGYEVIRFTNEEVLSEPVTVAQKIKEYLKEKFNTQFSPPLEVREAPNQPSSFPAPD